MEILKEPVRDRSAWVANDLRHDRSWIHELTPNELEELDTAMRAVRARGLTAGQFGREDFVLGALGDRIATLAREFEHGSGLFVLRGIPVHRYELPELKTLYWGIGVHLGSPVFQNKKGDLVSHVEDKGDDYGDSNTRLYTTAAAANPHNDPSDVVGLLCVRTAPVGGTSMVTSAMSIYNHILRDHPEYLEVLYRGFPHDLRSEGATGAAEEVTPEIPIFSFHAGKLSCCINSKSNRTAREKIGKPMTQFELDAIRCVEELAVDPQLCMTMDFRPGDIQFLNNYVTIHTRTAFEDGREIGERRLLLRQWLNLHEGRPLAKGFGDRFNNGSRGGVPARPANSSNAGAQ